MLVGTQPLLRSAGSADDASREPGSEPTPTGGIAREGGAGGKGNGEELRRGVLTFSRP